MAAAKAFALLQRARPWKFSGHLGWYTNNSACLRRLGRKSFSASGWRCHFESEAGAATTCHLPAASSKRDGWASMQAALWRPNAILRRRFQLLAHSIGYDAREGLIALHIRRGDKTTNMYNRYHSAADYVVEAWRHARELQLCTEEAPCQLFVASDDSAALTEVAEAVKTLDDSLASNLRVLGLSGSVSQRESAVGVELALQDFGDQAYEMAVEVMFDIEMLSRAAVLVGTLASQVSRLAGSIGVGDGTLRRAVALDIENLDEMRSLFSTWKIRVDDVPWQGPTS
eukprot:TRINITY_DN11695_c2_g1_i4.p1 TRINITY_DN11695_c2_g1~~TRINITY_DN11695_c2_g1_i4.p1  ORF type:complete len:285 (+),score=54.54 TRINITY_DN11695_c2_g1_i4:1176-2030(+)